MKINRLKWALEGRPEYDKYKSEFTATELKNGVLKGTPVEEEEEVIENLEGSE